MKLSIVFFICLGLCFNAMAKKHHDHDDDQDNDYDNHKGHKKEVVVERTVVVDRFSDNDRDVIVKFYERKHKKVPPGQAKKLRHVEVVVGQPAPPEVVRVFAPIPSDLAPLLPPPPPGMKLYVAGDQIVRVEGRTHRVVESMPIPGAGLPLPPPPLPFPPPPLPR
jgi:hypothetical protein